MRSPNPLFRSQRDPLRFPRAWSRVLTFPCSLFSEFEEFPRLLAYLLPLIHGDADKRTRSLVNEAFSAHNLFKRVPPEIAERRGVTSACLLANKGHLALSICSDKHVLFTVPARGLRVTRWEGDPPLVPPASGYTHRSWIVAAPRGGGEWSAPAPGASSPVFLVEVNGYVLLLGMSANDAKLLQTKSAQYFPRGVTTHEEFKELFSFERSCFSFTRRFGPATLRLRGNVSSRKQAASAWDTPDRDQVAELTNALCSAPVQLLRQSIPDLYSAVVQNYAAALLCNADLSITALNTLVNNLPEALSGACVATSKRTRHRDTFSGNEPTFSFDFCESEPFTAPLTRDLASVLAFVGLAEALSSGNRPVSERVALTFRDVVFGVSRMRALPAPLRQLGRKLLLGSENLLAAVCSASSPPDPPVLGSEHFESDSAAARPSAQSPGAEEAAKPEGAGTAEAPKNAPENGPRQAAEPATDATASLPEQKPPEDDAVPSNSQSEETSEQEEEGELSPHTGVPEGHGEAAEGPLGAGLSAALLIYNPHKPDSVCVSVNNGTLPLGSAHCVPPCPLGDTLEWLTRRVALGEIGTVRDLTEPPAEYRECCVPPRVAIARSLASFAAELEGFVLASWPSAVPIRASLHGSRRPVTLVLLICPAERLPNQTFKKRVSAGSIGDGAIGVEKFLPTYKKVVSELAGRALFDPQSVQTPKQCKRCGFRWASIREASERLDASLYTTTQQGSASTVNLLERAVTDDMTRRVIALRSETVAQSLGSHPRALLAQRCGVSPLFAENVLAGSRAPHFPETLTLVPQQPTLFLCLLLRISLSSGEWLLAANNRPAGLPCVPITRSKMAASGEADVVLEPVFPTRQDWNWLHGGCGEDAEGAKSPFAGAFFVAFKRLKELVDMPGLSVGELFNIKEFPLDERGLRWALFVTTSAKSAKLSSYVRSRFVWRTSRALEAELAQHFFPTLYNQQCAAAAESERHAFGAELKALRSTRTLASSASVRAISCRYAPDKAQRGDADDAGTPSLDAYSDILSYEASPQENIELLYGLQFPRIRESDTWHELRALGFKALSRGMIFKIFSNPFFVLEALEQTPTGGVRALSGGAANRSLAFRLGEEVADVTPKAVTDQKTQLRLARLGSIRFESYLGGAVVRRALWFLLGALMTQRGQRVLIAAEPELRYKPTARYANANWVQLSRNSISSLSKQRIVFKRDIGKLADAFRTASHPKAVRYERGASANQDNGVTLPTRFSFESLPAQFEPPLGAPVRCQALPFSLKQLVSEEPAACGIDVFSKGIVYDSIELALMRTCDEQVWLDVGSVLERVCSVVSFSQDLVKAVAYSEQGRGVEAKGGRALEHARRLEAKQFGGGDAALAAQGGDGGFAGRTSTQESATGDDSETMLGDEESAALQAVSPTDTPFSELIRVQASRYAEMASSAVDARRILEHVKHLPRTLRSVESIADESLSRLRCSQKKCRRAFSRFEQVQRFHSGASISFDPKTPSPSVKRQHVTIRPPSDVRSAVFDDSPVAVSGVREVSLSLADLSTDAASLRPRTARHDSSARLVSPTSLSGKSFSHVRDIRRLNRMYKASALQGADDGEPEGRSPRSGVGPVEIPPVTFVYEPGALENETKCLLALPGARGSPSEDGFAVSVDPSALSGCEFLLDGSEAGLAGGYIEVNGVCRMALKLFLSIAASGGEERLAHTYSAAKEALLLAAAFGDFRSFATLYCLLVVHYMANSGCVATSAREVVSAADEISLLPDPAAELLARQAFLSKVPLATFLGVLRRLPDRPRAWFSWGYLACAREHPPPLHNDASDNLSNLAEFIFSHDVQRAIAAPPEASDGLAWLGAYVQALDFSQCGFCAEISLVLAYVGKYCPNLEALDVSGQAVLEEQLLALVEACACVQVITAVSCPHITEALVEDLRTVGVSVDLRTSKRA